MSVRAASASCCAPFYPPTACQENHVWALKRWINCIRLCRSVLLGPPGVTPCMWTRYLWCLFPYTEISWIQMDALMAAGRFCSFIIDTSLQFRHVSLEMAAYSTSHMVSLMQARCVCMNIHVWTESARVFLSPHQLRFTLENLINNIHQTETGNLFTSLLFPSAHFIHFIHLITPLYDCFKYFHQVLFACLVTWPSIATPLQTSITSRSCDFSRLLY